MTQGKRILHISTLVGRASFGIGPIVLNLASAQQDLGNTVNIWCYDTLEEARFLEKSHGLLDQTIRTFPVLGPDRIGYSPIMEKSITEEGLSFDVVHQHGIWTGVSRAINRWRTWTGRPTIIAPQGSLEPWALRKSRWKKNLALAFYEHQNLHNVSCMQALSSEEASDIQAFGIYRPIAIIPNGIPETWMLQSHDSHRFRQRYNISNESRIMLFLGRITPKKGLPMLLHAMNDNREQLKGWMLIIAGVDEFNHQQEVQELTQKLVLQSYVQFVGPQFDQNKRDAFAAADVFVLPSYSEGAPIAILEALGAGVPVLTTKSSPWEELLSHNCGWWTEISEEAIADSLKIVLRQSQTVLNAMGKRAMQLVSEKYTWPQISEQTLNLYDWLLNNNEQPTFIFKE